MTKFTVAVIVGSLRKESINKKLAQALAKLGADKLEMTFLEIGDLPLFNQDLEADFPKAALRLKAEIKTADAVLFVTPEYNRSMPGVLKNALDWASRPYGQNAFAGKPAAVCGTSPGTVGTAIAQHDLRSSLNYLDVILMTQPEVYLQFKENLIDADGKITNPETQKFLQNFIDKYVAWVARHVGSMPKAKAA